MRSSEKHEHANSMNNVFGVNFHEFLEMQGNATSYEIASEFGISLGDVKKLKRQLKRY